MKVDYLMTGVIEGAYLEVSGLGDIDQSTGSLTFDLNVKCAPKGWDPGIIIMICCDNLRLLSAQIDKSDKLSISRKSLSDIQFGSKVNSLRQGTILNSDGDYVVSIKAKGFLKIIDGTATSRTVVVDGFSRLDEYGGIADIKTPYYEKVIITGPASASGISTYSIITGNGETLTGHTHYPYIFNDGSAPDTDFILEVSTANVNSIDFHASGENPKISCFTRKL
ncbi:hypothetical protein [Martelella endophytica]|uniref:hypothetical protein n=1 Tax=Martelella endophytica TaxID=1486262 RepID=UPI000AB71A3E|nr:hypothetical protein [Martelella endophytica]